MKTSNSINQLNKSQKMWRKVVLISTMLAVLITACTPSAIASPQEPRTSPRPISTTAAQSGMSTLPVTRAKSFLAEKLNINAETIQLVDVQAVQWPDSCLGVQTPGTMCAMHVVDGLKITLSANGQNYEVRTNLDGSQVVLAPNPVSTSAGQS